MNKRIISRVLIILLLITTVGGFLIFAEENPENVAGIYTIAAEDADYLSIADKEIKPMSSENIKNKVVLDISGCESDYCMALLNGKQLGFLENGENIFEFDSSLMLEGRNEIRIMLTSGDQTFSGGKKYGEYNLDDITVESVKLIFGSQKPMVPSSMINYLPIVNDIGAKPKETAYTEEQLVGDGWSNETQLGGLTPNIPIYVGYLFDKPSDNLNYFEINTTEFEDGIYKINIYKDNTVIETNTISIDNTEPVLNVSFKNGDIIANSNTITFGAFDNLPVNLTAKLNGMPINGNSIPLKSFAGGNHTLYLMAEDSLGNSVESIYNFTVKQTIPDYDMKLKEKSAVLSIPDNASAKIYSLDLLGRINMYINRRGPFEMSGLRTSNEVLVSFRDKANITTQAFGNTMPYQAFVIDVEGNTGTAIISYNGETGNGEDILLEGWNYNTEKWDTLAVTDSGAGISFDVDIEKYSKDNKMRIKASPYVYSNGSDTLLWVTDTQYYSRYDDLNHVYTEIMNFSKDEYITGNIGYVAHTGDLIDRSQSGDKIAHDEYKVASEAQKILDNAFVPNGVVSGNHDIKNTDSDYSYYYEYFGADRYENFEWYGGSYKNNMHHYDLITLGRYNFLFLYIGCYEENKSDTIAWANSVLEAYPERNAVICTHEYLLPSGEFSGNRAQDIWEKIIVPNQNVKMVLCGHNVGVANQLRRVDGTNRFVLEILADYQFAELNIEPIHIENGCTCDGEGFIRLMTFNDAGQVITTTYSPTADKYNYYPSYEETFVYDLDLIPAVRSIKTTDFSIGVNIKEEGEFGKDKIKLSGVDGMFAVITEGNIEYTTEILHFKDKIQPYSVFADSTDYNIDYERYEITGMSGVLQSLRRDELNELPSDKLVEIGLNLMPSEANKVNRTSGSSNYIPTYSESGKFSLNFDNTDNNTWVTTELKINEQIDAGIYNRLYFGVSSDTNAKWNLYVNFSNGKAINFSQNLFKHFGYDDYCIPSDIKGTWQGYIPLEEYVKGDVTVKSVYFVSAAPNTEIIFDYFFFGRSLGEEVLFVTDENTAYSVDCLENGKVSVPTPVKNGYIFEGWFTEAEGGEQIQLPVKVKDGGLTAYARFIKKDQETGKTDVFYNDEVDVMPGPSYNKLLLIVVICLTLLSGVVAGLIFAVSYKKRKMAKSDR